MAKPKQKTPNKPTKSNSKRQLVPFCFFPNRTGCSCSDCPAVFLPCLKTRHFTLQSAFHGWSIELELEHTCLYNALVFCHQEKKRCRGCLDICCSYAIVQLGGLLLFPWWWRSLLGSCCCYASPFCCFCAIDIFQVKSLLWMRWQFAFAAVS